MVRVALRLIGLGEKDGGRTTVTRTLKPGTTVGELWESLQQEASPGDRLTIVTRERLLALVNGRPIGFLDGWETELGENDTVTYMPKAFGG